MTDGALQSYTAVLSCSSIKSGRDMTQLLP